MIKKPFISYRATANTFLGLIAIKLLTSCVNTYATTVDSDQINTNSICEQPCSPRVLNVGLYPYVPRIDQFKNAISNEWNKRYPNISLNFVSESEWDGGYDTAPSKTLDVFVFDAFYFETYFKQGLLEPIKQEEIGEFGDILDYAKDGVKVGNDYFGIPQLGCASLLFYRKDDFEIDSINSLSELTDVLGSCQYTSAVPPDNTGLMLDLGGGTTNTAFYLDLYHSINQHLQSPLPTTAEELDAKTISAMQSIVGVSSLEHISASLTPYRRASWFSNGIGRAFIGYSESMSVMSKATRENIKFKPLPTTEGDKSPFFYADIVGVNPSTKTYGYRSLAIELANLITSNKVMIASLGSDKLNPFPQYLMPTKHSTFKALGKNFPVYESMHKMVLDYEPVMFKLPPDGKSWVSQIKDIIRSNARENYSCGCSFATELFIEDKHSAESICSTTCEQFGGWNGSWNNTPPTAPSGGSSCECNSCSF